MKLALLIAAAAFALFDGSTSDPWESNEIVQPKTLAGRLAANDRPPIFYVGFPTLYRNGPHIPGARLAGPCSKAEGLDALKQSVASLPKDKELIVYCGCCPFVRCPNIRPAYSALREMGFKKITVLAIETNLHTDWVEKQYPTEKAPAAQ